MANIKITDLTAYTDPDTTDVLPIVDVGADATKKVAVGEVVGKITGDVDVATDGTSSIASGVIVNADVNASAAIAGTKIDPDFGSQTVETTGVFSAAGGAAATPSITFTGDLNTGIYSPGADQVALSTGGAGRLFVDSSGNVGVGFSTPTTFNQAAANRLIVGNGSGTQGLTIYSGTANEGVIAFADGTTTIEQYRGYIGYNHSGDFMRFFTSAAERLRITSDGKVGLGTSSPTSRLQIGDSTVSSSNVIKLGRRVASTENNFPLIGHTSSDGVENSLGLCACSGGGSIQFFTGNNSAGFGTGYNDERMRITSAGRVGIGVATPGVKLEINGTTNNNSSAIFRRTDVSRSAIIGGNRDTSNCPFVGTTDNEAFAFITNNNERARIDSSGNVGVGTTSPSCLLDVRRSSAGNVVAFTGSTDGSRALKFVSADNGIYLGARWTRDIGSSNGIHAWAINGTERLRIDASGRLLVGTSSASGSNLLQVNSDALINGITVGRGPGDISSNTAVGSGALYSNTTGASNVAYGVQALYANSTASNNAAFGWRALRNNTTGESNVAMGRDALLNNGTANNNTAIGFYAAINNTGSNITALGARALYSSTGSYNIGIGYGAGDAITTGSNNTIIGDIPGTATLSDTVIIGAGATERLRIDGSGRLLVGTSSSRGVGGGIQANLQIEGTGTGANTTACSVSQNSNDANGPRFMLAKSRSTSNGGVTIVQGNDSLGIIDFAGADGTDAGSSAVRISAEVDGTPGANDMPGRLVFSVTGDGNSSPTERLRINNSGAIGLSGANFGSAGQVLVSNGSSAAPTWEQITPSAVFGWDHDDDTYGLYLPGTSIKVSDLTGTVDIDVQSRMRRCVINDSGVVQYYLDADDSDLKSGDWLRIVETEALDTAYTGTISESTNSLLRVGVPAWAAGTYTLGRRVTYGGSLWECIAATTTATPAAGTVASDLTGTDGQVVVEVPAFSVRYGFLNGVHTREVRLGCNDSLIAQGFQPHPAFIKTDGSYKDAFYIGAYHTYDDAGTGSSVSGQTNTRSQTRATFRTEAEARGTGWHVLSYLELAAIQTLLVCEFQDYNSQKVIGNGSDAGTTYGVTTGQSDGDGNHSVNSTDNASNADDYMAYRGIENLYGRSSQFVDGINAYERMVYLTNDQTAFADNTANGYEFYAQVPTGVSTYQKELHPLFDVFLPSVVTGASDTTYLGDGFASTTGWRVAAVGGNCNTGAQAGAFNLSVYTASAGFGSSSAGIGSRLCYAAN